MVDLPCADYHLACAGAREHGACAWHGVLRHELYYARMQRMSHNWGELHTNVTTRKSLRLCMCVCVYVSTSAIRRPPVLVRARTYVCMWYMHGAARNELGE